MAIVKDGKYLKIRNVDLDGVVSYQVFMNKEHRNSGDTEFLRAIKGAVTLAGTVKTVIEHHETVVAGETITYPAVLDEQGNVVTEAYTTTAPDTTVVDEVTTTVENPIMGMLEIIGNVDTSLSLRNNMIKKAYVAMKECDEFASWEDDK